MVIMFTYSLLVSNNETVLSTGLLRHRANSPVVLSTVSGQLAHSKAIYTWL